MAKILVVTKPDKTTHKLPLSNKAAILRHNTLLDKAEQWKVEEMDEKEAEKVPFVDESYVTAGEALLQLDEKEKTIKDLEAKLALLQGDIEKKEAEAKDAADKAAAKAAKDAAKDAAKAEASKPA